MNILLSIRSGVFLAFLWCCPFVSVAQAWIPDESSVKQAAQELRSELEKQLSSTGVDLETSHFNLAIGFCTSPFSKDPAPAAFSRALATELVETMLLHGEQVSGFAWEFGVWDHKAGQARAMTVDKSATSLGWSADLWPLTSQNGSAGGHDTERSIVEICQLISQPRTIVVLFANSAASVAGANTPIGENASQYLTTLLSWNRIGTKNKSGASLEIDFFATKGGSPKQQRKLDVVLLVPRSWQARPLEGGTRSKLIELSKKTQTIPPVTDSRGGGFSPILPLSIAAGLGALIYLVYKVLGPRGPLFLRIGDRSFNMEDVPVGDLICRLIGQGSPVIGAQDVVVMEAPPIPLAELFKRSDGFVEIESSGRLCSVNGIEKNLENGRFPFSAKGEIVIVLDGSVSRPGLPPNSYTAEIVLSFYREGKQNG